MVKPPLLLLLALGLAAGEADGPDADATPVLALDRAVALTLRHQAMLALAREDVAEARGRVREAAGAFDTALRTAADYDEEIVLPGAFGFSRSTGGAIGGTGGGGPLSFDELLALQSGDPGRQFDVLRSAATSSPDRIDSSNVHLEAGLRRPTRSGLVFEAGAGIDRDKIAEFQVAADNRYRAFAGLRVPLLRGRGIGTAGPERVLRDRAEAEELRLARSHSEAAVATATAYWEYGAALRRRAILAQVRDRAAQIRDTVAKAVELGGKPPQELEQARADLADRRAELEGAELAVARSGTALLRALGVPAATGLPGRTQDPVWPAPADLGVFADEGAAALTRTALRRRDDLRASRVLVDAAETSWRSARRNAAPRLDLTGRVGYVGHEPGDNPGDFFGATHETSAGPVWMFGVEFTYPFANRAAEGRAAQRLAALRRARIRAAEERRAAELAIGLGVEELRREVAAAAAEAEAVEHHRAVVDAHRDMYEGGQTSLLDYLRVRDLLARARLRAATSAHRAAAAAVRLRHRFGVLVREDGGTAVADGGRLLALPVPDDFGGGSDPAP